VQLKNDAAAFFNDFGDLGVTPIDGARLRQNLGGVARSSETIGKL
jgi:hypothetical protein